MVTRRSRFSKRVRKSIAKKPVRKTGEKAKVKQIPLRKMKAESLKNQPVQNFPTGRRVAAHGSRFRGAVEEEVGAGFLGYTDLDPGSDMVITEDKIDFSGLPIDEKLYVTKDYGASFFGNFTHRFRFHWEVSTEDGAGYGGSCLIYGLSASANLRTVSEFEAQSTDGFSIDVWRFTTVYRFMLTSNMIDEKVVQYTPGDPPATYWIEVERIGDILTMKVYSDSGFNNLLVSAGFFAGSGTLRYHTALGGKDGPTDVDTITGYIDSLAMTVPATPTPPDFVDIDLATYSVTDENSDFTIISSKADFDTMRVDANSHITEDYGAGNLRDFSFRFKVNFADVTGVSGQTGKAIVWAVNDQAHFTINDMSINDTGIYIILTTDAGAITFAITLRDEDLNKSDTFTIPGSLPANYWVEVRRVGGTTWATIYSDDAYSTFVTGLIIDSVDTPMRYHIAVGSADIGTDADYITGYVGDYKIAYTPTTTTTTTTVTTTTTSTVTTTTASGTILETWGENTVDDHNNRAEDTGLQEWSPDTNNGTSATSIIGDVGAGIGKDLFRFTPNQDIAGKFVSYATLFLYVTSVPNGGSFRAGVYRSLQDWVELQATWNDFATSTPWNTAGAEAAHDSGVDDGIYDRHATPLDRKWLAAIGYRKFDVTELVREWVNGTTKEYGFVVQSDEAPDSGRWVNLNLSNAPDGARPYLLIAYVP